VNGSVFQFLKRKILSAGKPVGQTQPGRVLSRQDASVPSSLAFGVL
jgi:hypothetical protein